VTLSLKINGSQRVAGGPVQITAQQLSSDEDDSFPYLFLGVTTTSTPPATFGALAHADHLEWDAAGWDTGGNQLNSQRSGGLIATFSNN